MSRKIILVLIVGLFLMIFSGMTFYNGNILNEINELEEKQNYAHLMAEYARKLGYEEEHIIIKEAQSKWWEIDNNIIELRESLLDVEYYTYDDVLMCAKVIYAESRGIYSLTEQANIVWTILNRVDNYESTISEIITAPNQFAYSYNLPTMDDYGRDLTWLAEDVLIRWSLEKAGNENVGRTLPSNFMFYGGNGRNNTFRTEYNIKTAIYWDYSLESPYNS